MDYLADMKMDTMNISLTPDQSEYVRRNVARDFGNTSEFFRNLIRERMQVEVESDLKFLDSTVPGAPAGPGEQDIQEILQTQRAVRKELKQRERRP